MTSTPSIVVVGAGAVGSYFGALLARAGARVTLIGRAAHVDAIRADGLRLQTAAGVLRITGIEADTGYGALRGAELILCCVKSAATEALAREIAPLLRADAVVLSLQNGVENPQRLARHLPCAVVAGVVYAALSLPAPGLVRHAGGGELVLGAVTPGLAPARLEAIAARWTTAGVAVRLSDQPLAELWHKLVVNCAWNAISALTQADYATIAADADLRELQLALLREAVAVARAEGQGLEFEALRAAVERIAVAMPTQRSSTAQDLAAAKPTEIDDLNGAVVRIGARHGIATPFNAALTALVRLRQNAACSRSAQIETGPRSRL
ncbi:MAG: 2-dehydropantoate 2-reductase [Burkholderiales bacterium]|nr:2-dehydropantoate 2-reductase [Burkholderiales bacterium]